MFNHSPEGYNCPFCLVSQGIQNEHVLTSPEDVFYHDAYLTAFIAAHSFENNKGHVLIIPNAHYENIYDLPAPLSARIHTFAREVALALKQEYACEGVSTRQHNEPCGNQDVWHYHLHVFPRYENDRLYTSGMKLLPPHERRAYADRLRNHFTQCRPGTASQLSGASVIVHKEGRILLQQRRDNQCWGYHGGRVELGERVEDAARRELYEETGLTARKLTLFGVFSGPELHHIYPDGNEVYIIDTVYVCNDFTGTLTVQEDECLDLQWFDFGAIPEKLSPPVIPALKQFLGEWGGRFNGVL